MKNKVIMFVTAMTVFITMQANKSMRSTLRREAHQNHMQSFEQRQMIRQQETLLRKLCSHSYTTSKQMIGNVSGVNNVEPLTNPVELSGTMVVTDTMRIETGNNFTLDQGNQVRVTGCGTVRINAQGTISNINDPELLIFNPGTGNGEVKIEGNVLLTGRLVVEPTATLKITGTLFVFGDVADFIDIGAGATLSVEGVSVLDGQGVYNAKVAGSFTNTQGDITFLNCASSTTDAVSLSSTGSIMATTAHVLFYNNTANAGALSAVFVEAGGSIDTTAGGNVTFDMNMSNAFQAAVCYQGSVSVTGGANILFTNNTGAFVAGVQFDGTGIDLETGVLRFENNLCSGAGTSGVFVNCDIDSGSSTNLIEFKNNRSTGAAGFGFKNDGAKINHSGQILFDGNSCTATDGIGVFMTGSDIGLDASAVIFQNNVGSTTGHGVQNEGTIECENGTVQFINNVGGNGFFNCSSINTMSGTLDTAYSLLFSGNRGTGSGAGLGYGVRNTDRITSETTPLIKRFEFVNNVGTVSGVFNEDVIESLNNDNLFFIDNIGTTGVGVDNNGGIEVAASRTIFIVNNCLCCGNVGFDNDGGTLTGTQSVINTALCTNLNL